MSAQASLFDWTPPRPAPAATEQQRELARVASGIGSYVLGWCRQHLDAGQRTFHLAALEEDIQCQHPSTPGSAGRILRDLRASGHVAYRVLSRRDSLYELESVR